MRPASSIMAAAVLMMLAGCGEEFTGPGGLRTGTYVATTFVITPAGEAPIDVLAGGGSLSIVLKAGGATSGTLTIPASITGGAQLVASMAGTATITSFTVKFHQEADTFVRDLDWTRAGEVVSVTNQVVAGTSFTIALIRS